MKKQPIHKNLSTSFVNVGALVRHLRSLQFAGSIHIELASYEADIVFTSSNTIRAREYDHIAGRISHGEHALQRILIRAKEPHGRIHVYKSLGGYAEHDDESTFVDGSIVKNARRMAASNGGTTMQADASQVPVSSSRNSENALVLAALSAVLRTIDESLAARRLSFSAAFRVACDAITPEFPFLQQSRNALVYKNGEITLHTETDVELVSSAVFAALRPIFRRLRREQKYGELFQILSGRLRELSAERRQEFVSLGLMNYVHALLAREE